MSSVIGNSTIGGSNNGLADAHAIRRAELREEKRLAALAQAEALRNQLLANSSSSQGSSSTSSSNLIDRINELTENTKKIPAPNEIQAPASTPEKKEITYGRPVLYVYVGTTGHNKMFYLQNEVNNWLLIDEYNNIIPRDHEKFGISGVKKRLDRGNRAKYEAAAAAAAR